MRLIPILLASVPTLTSCVTPIQAELDAEVKRLCAIDGGAKVYETVSLPPERFNEYGQINFYDPAKGEDTLGPDYIFKREETYYRKGNPQMTRMHYQVIRRHDGKLLGETVFYGRGGGDIPSPMHGTTFVCPPYSEADSMMLLTRIFVPVKR